MEHIVLGDRLITIRTSSLEEKVWEGGGDCAGWGLGFEEPCDQRPPGV